MTAKESNEIDDLIDDSPPSRRIDELIVIEKDGTERRFHG